VGTERDWADVFVGRNHTCARRSEGSLWCWGGNGTGQLGDSTTIDRKSPARVGMITDWVSGAASETHTCGLRAEGTLWCWGLNDNGQAGTGEPLYKTTPVQV